MGLPATTSQTVGPFFKLGFAPLYGEKLGGPAVSGERINIHGRIVDGDGQAVPDAVLEIWQADVRGQYAHPQDRQGSPTATGFMGFGRVATGQDGSFCFSTIKPGPVAGPAGSVQAPHIVVSIFMRGLLTRLVTRIYFSGDPGNDRDFVLSLVPSERRRTLLAQPVPERDGELEWNVRLQGDRETVFFDC